ncbi:hypothetical protein AJ87_40575 [Rhizobium yanglingense]|nr:hypothetical protein AJ87_40575 [Rhizobium yanglingense]
MELADIVDAELYGLDDARIDQLEGRIELRLGDLEIGLGDICLVEFAAEPGKRLVTLCAHGFEDWRDPFDEARDVGFRAAQQRRLFLDV